MAALLVLMAILWLCIRLVALGLRYWRRHAVNHTRLAGEQTVAHPSGAAAAGTSRLTEFDRRWDVAQREFDSVPIWTFELTDDIHDWAEGLMTGPVAQAPYNGETTQLLADTMGVEPRHNALERALFKRAITDGVLLVPVPGFFIAAYASRDPITELSDGTGYGFIPDGFEELAVWACKAVAPSNLGWGVATGPDAVVTWMTAVIATFTETQPRLRPAELRPAKD